MCVPHAILLTPPKSSHPSQSILSPTVRLHKSFSCNTYGSPRKCCKQKTYSKAKPFRCNTYKKQGAAGYSPLPHGFPLSPVFRTLFQVPYLASLLFAILTKTPGVWWYSSQLGTRSSHSLCVKSFFSFELSTFDCQPLHPVTANWLSFTSSDKIGSLPTPCRKIDRAHEELL